MISPSGLASVLRLLKSCRPAAIIRRIWTVILAALNRHPGWTWSHVVNECLKAISPSVAYRYPTLAVVFVVFTPRVEAPLFHCSPHVPEVRMSQSVCSRGNGEQYSFHATATYGVSALDRSDSDEAGCAAIAFELPNYTTALSFFSGANRNEPAKSQTLEICRVKVGAVCHNQLYVHIIG